MNRPESRNYFHFRVIPQKKLNKGIKDEQIEDVSKYFETLNTQKKEIIYD